MRVFYLLLFAFWIKPMSSQSVYVELLGKGFVNSVNYEHALTKKIFGLKIQAGIGFAPSSFISVPVTVSQVFGKKNNHLEVGVGGTYVNGFLWLDDDSFGPDVSAHAVVYYRYQKPDGRLIFKIGVTPFIGDDLQTGMWFGTGIGYAFKK